MVAFHHCLSLLSIALFSLLLLDAAESFTPLAGVKVKSLKSNEDIDLSNFLSSGEKEKEKPLNLLVFGTYAADFNAIEYAQRLRYYLPKLKESGVGKFGLILNCEEEAALKLADLVDLSITREGEGEEGDVEVMIDPSGAAGRSFGVGQGWRPDDDEMSPYLKLFGMLWGLGAWATLPAVIGGYIGNPFFGQPWIEDAMAVGQRKGRWPNTALDLDQETGDIVLNKFTELPYGVGEWPRRPLELATLRLQNMMDISIKNWKELAPTEEALSQGVLTQLGGCIVVDSNTEEVKFKWRDPGICAVANFETMLEKINKEESD